VELEEVRGGSDERYPVGARIRFDFPARGGMAPVKVYWYEGLRKDATTSPRGSLHAADKDSQNLPPLLAQLQKQYPDEELNAEKSGSIYVGEKGVLYTGTYGGKMHLVPMDKWISMTQPPRTMPRPKNVMADFLGAVRSGKKETAAPFDYGARLTEFTLLGNLAQHAGLGKKVEWDGPNMKVTNLKDLNEWIKRPCRAGWPS
jgi:hypothetical protein